MTKDPSMKLKKKFSIISLFIFAFFLYSNKQSAQCNQEVIITTSQLTDPTKTIILWDLHGVVFTRKISEIMTVIWHYDRKLEILKYLDTSLFKLMGAFLLQLLRLTPQEITSEELIATARNANNKPLVELAIQIGSAYFPIEGTLEIIKELNQAGYQQDVGSNIGTTLYNIFKEKYPTIFDYFNHIFIVHYYPGQKIIKKPNKEYFTTYLTDYNIDADNVVFIDDRIANVQAARAVGMHAIHFQNPDQLRATLQDLGIPLATKKAKYIEQNG